MTDFAVQIGRSRNLQELFTFRQQCRCDWLAIYIRLFQLLRQENVSKQAEYGIRAALNMKANNDA